MNNYSTFQNPSRKKFRSWIMKGRMLYEHDTFLHNRGIFTNKIFGVGIGIACVIVILVFSISFSNLTTYDDENIYGISAQVVRSVDPLPIMCPTEPCPITHFQLVVDSEIPAIIEQYKICLGFSCIQNNEIRYETKGNLGLIPLFEIESWKVGDLISIKVGASTLYEGTDSHPPPITKYIDLGESEVKEEIIGSLKITEHKYSNQECADLFDHAFDTWEKYVNENYGGPGQPTMEPPQTSWILSGWKDAKEFRESDCRFRVDDWAYLVKPQEQVWGYIDWPNLEPFKPKPEPEPDYNFDKTFTLIGKRSQYNLDYSLPGGTITDIQLNCDSLRLVLSVTSPNSKVLTLLLPDDIIGNIETILVDKIEYSYISYAGNTVSIMIPEKANTIEIGGSYRDDQRNVECR